jgi:hypothetical protein
MTDGRGEPPWPYCTYFDTAGVSPHADEEHDPFLRPLAATGREPAITGSSAGLRAMLEEISAAMRRAAWRRQGRRSGG